MPACRADVLGVPAGNMKGSARSKNYPTVNNSRTDWTQVLPVVDT